MDNNWEIYAEEIQGHTMKELEIGHSLIVDAIVALTENTNHNTQITTKDINTFIRDYATNIHPMSLQMDKNTILNCIDLAKNFSRYRTIMQQKENALITPDENGAYTPYLC